jgi:hypothetical protein
MRLRSSWAAWAAATWSLLYGCLAVYWACGGRGFPFAPVDETRRSGSVLEGSRAAVAAPIMALIALAGAGVAVAMARGAGSGRTATVRDAGSGRTATVRGAGSGRTATVRGADWSRTATVLIAFGWTTAAALTLVIPDYSLLAVVAFAPLLLVFAFTGVPGQQDGVGDILYWHRTNLIILFAGGLIWALATVAYRRRIRGACEHCGRKAGESGPSREILLRWGRRAVTVACLAPLPYEITRLAWYAGIPLGISHDFLRMMQDTPTMLDVGLGCAIASAAGGVLTHGLVSRWGEVFPRWVWFAAGKRVPPMLAVVPASIVALTTVPAGLMLLWTTSFRSSGWALYAPSLLWVVWGVALGAATYAYYLRRRPACQHCLLADAQLVTGEAHRFSA